MLKEDEICRNCGHSFKDSHQMTLGKKVVTVNKVRCRLQQIKPGCYSVVKQTGCCERFEEATRQEARGTSEGGE